jgi:hypothetical protein
MDDFVLYHFKEEDSIKADQTAAAPGRDPKGKKHRLSVYRRIF